MSHAWAHDLVVSRPRDGIFDGIRGTNRAEIPTNEDAGGRETEKSEAWTEDPAAESPA